MEFNFVKNQIEHNQAPNDSNSNVTIEYTSLRSEIDQNDTSGMQLFAASLIIVAAIMGFAFKAAVSPLLRIGSFCAIVGIICIIIRQTIDRIRMTFIIAAYLRRFVEPKLKDVQWETRLQNFRKFAPKIAFDRQNNMLAIYKYIGSLNMILATGYFLQFINTLSGKNFVISIGKKNYLSISNLYIALLGILLSLFLFIYTWIDINIKIKNYITNNAEFVEKQWDEVAKRLASDVNS